MSEKQALEILEQSNINIFKYFQYMGIIFNSCLCVDLYLTYKEPFYPIDRRIKIYVITGVFVSFIMSWIAGTILQKDDEFYDQFIESMLKVELVDQKDDTYKIVRDKTYVDNKSYKETEYIYNKLMGQFY